MANKNTAGNTVARNMHKIERLIDEIDRRAKSGEDRENLDESWHNHTIAANGDRVWSF